MLELAARGKPSTKLSRGRLLSRCTAEAAAFLQMNCRSCCISPDELQKTLHVKKMNTHEHKLHPKNAFLGSKSNFIKTNHLDISSRAK